MANMSTHAQHSWDRLLAGNNETSLACASLFREWMLTDLLKVSRLLQSRLEAAQDNPIWRHVLSSPIDTFAVSKAVWEEFVGALSRRPPTFDPEALWDWAESILWKLLVFVDPDEACDNDQFELELWWSASSQKAVFVCGLGEHYKFRRRTSRAKWKPAKWKPLEPCKADTEDLMPAPRTVVIRLFPDVELLA